MRWKTENDELIAELRCCASLAGAEWGGLSRVLRRHEFLPPRGASPAQPEAGVARGHWSQTEEPGFRPFE